MANPALTKNGDPCGGPLGFLKILQKYMREENPTNIVVVWDGYGGSIKKKNLYKEYKEKRIPPRLNRFVNNLDPKDLEQNKMWQLQRLVEYLNEMPVLQLVCDYVEADDLIGYLVKNNIFGNYDKQIILSNDKDFIQLINEGVEQIRPTTDERLTVDKALELNFIHPNNFALAKAICGDDSDNIKGIEGAGFKSCAKRFPCLQESQARDTVWLASECQTKIDSGTKVKLYAEISKSLHIVERNLQLMSLGDVDLSKNCLDKILYDIANFSTSFNGISFLKLLMDDGLVGTNFDELKKWCKKKAS